LEKNKIGTRNVFAGNLLRHPGYVKIRKNFKIIDGFSGSDIIMNSAFWLGVWPGINKEKINFITTVLKRFLKKYEDKK